MSQKESDWIKESSVSVGDLDRLIKEMREAQSEYDRQRVKKSEAQEKLDRAKASVLALLLEAGKTKYFAEEIGTVVVVNKYAVKTPKGLTEKEKFFDWISNRFGRETLSSLLSINSITLNAFVNELKQNDPLVDIPGLDAPTHEKQIRFTAKK